MLNFDKWKKVNESYFGLCGGVLGGPITPNSIGGPIAQGNFDVNSFRTLGDSYPENSAPNWMGDEIPTEDEDEMEDDEDVKDIEDDEEDIEEDEEEMEDIEDDEEDEEDEDDEDDEYEDEDEEDEDDEDHTNHHHHVEENRKNSSNGKKKCMKSKKNCDYMEEGNTSFSSIPTLDEWKKSVASMYDPKFFEGNYDGINNVNEENNYRSVGGQAKKVNESYGRAMKLANLAGADNAGVKGTAQTKNLAIMSLTNLYRTYQNQNPNMKFPSIRQMMLKHLNIAIAKMQKAEKIEDMKNAENA